MHRTISPCKALTDIFGLDFGALGEGHEAVKDGLVEGGVGSEQSVGHPGVKKFPVREEKRRAKI